METSGCRSSSKSSLKSQTAQALVEFALVLPLLMLLILGVIEFGRVFQTKIVMENAAREGAHYMIYDRGDPDNGFPNTISAVVTEAVNSGVTLDSTEVIVRCLTAGVVNSPPNNCPSGTTVEVLVIKDYQMSILGFLSGAIPLNSNARMFVP